MAKNKKIIIFVIIFSIVFLSSELSAQVYLGIVDGYVKNTEGEIVQGAKVSTQVSECSGNGCFGESVSNDKGYYIIGNLNLPKNGRLTVNAVKDSSFGSASGISDQYHIAHIDVIICDASTKPVLQDIEDSHSNLFNFKWTSGKDAKNRPIYDEFELNKELSREISGITKKLDFGDYIWRVRTCNNFCCSDFSTDSFKSFNNPPSKPSASTSVLSGIGVLDWKSGVDPEGDPIYDEVEFNGEVKKSIPPLTVKAEGIIKWKVRTCDIYGACSLWNDEETFSCKVVEPTCPTSNEISRAVSDFQVFVEDKKKEKITQQKMEFLCNGEEIERVRKIEIKNGKLTVFGEDFVIDNFDNCNIIKKKSLVKKEKNYKLFILPLIILLILIIYIIYKLRKHRRRNLLVR